MANVTHSAEAFYCGSSENLSIISGYSGLLQSLKGNVDPHISALSKHFTSTSGDANWQNSEKNEGHSREPVLPPLMLEPDRKRTRNIGMNSKRLLIDSQEALELKLTWEEAQDLLRPPLSSKPSVVVIDDHTFEEYDVSNYARKMLTIHYPSPCNFILSFTWGSPFFMHVEIYMWPFPLKAVYCLFW